MISDKGLVIDLGQVCEHFMLHGNCCIILQSECNTLIFLPTVILHIRLVIIWMIQLSFAKLITGFQALIYNHLTSMHGFLCSIFDSVCNFSSQHLMIVWGTNMVPKNIFHLTWSTIALGSTPSFCTELIEIRTSKLNSM